MLTLPVETGPGATVVADRPAYRPYRATVVGMRSLSDHFTRMTFFSKQFDTSGTAGFDQRIKVVLPLPGRGLADIGADDERSIVDGDWYARWRALPDADRSPFRTYTIRAVRPEQREIDVVFVTHAGHGLLGPAARWLQAARIGSDVLIVGPDERSPGRAVGLDWHPAQATELLLAGDETAAPAICSILESLPAGRRARAFIEVPTQADALPLVLPAGCEVTWLARDAAPHGERLDQAVRDWVASNRPLVDTAVTASPQPLAEVDVDCDLLWESPGDEAGTGFPGPPRGAISLRSPEPRSARAMRPTPCSHRSTPRSPTRPPRTPSSRARPSPSRATALEPSTSTRRKTPASTSPSTSASSALPLSTSSRPTKRASTTRSAMSSSTSSRVTCW